MGKYHLFYVGCAGKIEMCEEAWQINKAYACCSVKSLNTLLMHVCIMQIYISCIYIFYMRKKLVFNIKMYLAGLHQVDSVLFF